MSRLYTFLYRFILLFGGLYALSPCTVKDALWSELGQEYVKPLNKNRSAHQKEEPCKVALENSCYVSSPAGKVYYPLPLADLQKEPGIHLISINQVSSCINKDALPAYKTIPLFILHQCLKIDTMLG